MRWRIITLTLTGVLAVALSAASAYAWLADDDGHPPAAGVPANEQAAIGAQLFQVKGCAACQSVASDGMYASSTGPNLSRLPEEAGTRVEGMSAEEYVRVSIAAPDSYLLPGYGFYGPDGFFAMPALPVTPAEIDALTEFLLAQEPAGD